MVVINLKLNKMECYIDYLDYKNNFRKTRKDFETYEQAKKWLFKNMEKPNLDTINFYN